MSCCQFSLACCLPSCLLAFLPGEALALLGSEESQGSDDRHVSLLGFFYVQAKDLAVRGSTSAWISVSAEDLPLTDVVPGLLSSVTVVLREAQIYIQAISADTIGKHHTTPRTARNSIVQHSAAHHSTAFVPKYAAQWPLMQSPPCPNSLNWVSLAPVGKCFTPT